MKKVGDLGENLAKDFLERNGYKILERNFRFGRIGEIDLIAEKDEKIIFIEVKFRQNNKFGSPLESITKSKLQKIEQTIYHYVEIKNIDVTKIQFGVISIEKREKSFHLEFMKNIEFE